MAAAWLAGVALWATGAAVPADTGRPTPPSISGPRDLLRWLGIDQSHFRMLSDGRPWQEGEDEVMLKVMYRLARDFRLEDVEAWSRGDPDLAALAKDPDAGRGEVFRPAGRVVSVEVCRPVQEVARRFELDQYYRCRFVLGGREQPAVVFARTIPEAWKGRRSIDERAGALAIFLKNEGEDPNQPLPVFVASRVAWYPPTRLGDLGMDAGLLDDLRPRTIADQADRQHPPPPHGDPDDLRLTARNRECFYQMLAAVGRSKPGELLAEATRELRRSGQERFSVVPLFNEPLEQQGRLAVLSGTARQVIPVRVSDEDIVSRFGIDHYYQVFLFAEDSQGNPLVFCVREIPAGMPVGEGPDFAEYVTVAGFFFNTWAYRNRQSPDAAMGEGQWQLAPLLVGRDLQWHPPQKPAANRWMGAIAGGLFVLALVGIWLAIWRSGQSDKKFRETLAKR